MMRLIDLFLIVLNVAVLVSTCRFAHFIELDKWHGENGQGAFLMVWAPWILLSMWQCYSWDKWDKSRKKETVD